MMKSNYRVNNILTDVNGHAETGQLLAIMGPTGCGKTSLLNVLAARMPEGGSSNLKLTGEVFVNGNPRDDETLRRSSAYVLQDDKMYVHLTVYETLLLASHFYLPSTCPLETKINTVSNVMTELGLNKTRDTLIGDEKVRGISGGELKRVNIATQLISQPTILFLDEPTSGLDSFQALSVMECMKSLAAHGRLVLTVIHQPRSSIFEMFDQLLLLSTGRTMYFGPASNAADYFASVGFPCPPLFNPSDYFLDILSPDNRNKEAEKTTNDQIEVFAQCWKDHYMNHNSDMTTSANRNDIETTPMNPSAAAILDNGLKKVFINIRMLFWRSFTEISRDYITITNKTVFIGFFACILGAVFANLGDDQQSIDNRRGVLFICALNQAFNNATVVFNTFPKEKIIVNRERSSNAYDTLSYFFAKFISEIPFNVLPTLVYCCVLYFIVGLKTDRFGAFIGILMLETVTAIAFGLVIGSFVSTPEICAAIGPLTLIIMFLFAGFYINIESLPVVVNLIPYISLIRWTFQALCINEFKDQKFTCRGNAGTACFRTGEEVLASLSFENTTLNEAIMGLGVVLIGYIVLALLGLHVSKAKYIALGFTGSNMKTRAPTIPQQKRTFD